MDLRLRVVYRKFETNENRNCFVRLKRRTVTQLRRTSDTDFPLEFLPLEIALDSDERVYTSYNGGEIDGVEGTCHLLSHPLRQ